MISKLIPKWFMARDIAFISEKTFFHEKKKKKIRIDIWFISTRAPKVNQSLLSMICLQSWSSAEFYGAGYEKYVEFANIWQYLATNIAPVW